MASRKEQKEQLRREREEREAAANAAAQRKRMVGYGAAILLVSAVVVILVVVIVGGGDDGGGSENVGGSVLPDGGSVPDQKVTDLDEAAKAAGCELKSFKGTSREHTDDLAEQIQYSSSPPTSGKHYVEPAEDGAYDEAPDPKQLVHSMEHGRVIIWFKPNLPADDRADLAALFNEDTYQMLITPDPTRMKYQVAATAWNAEPLQNGTGRLLGCPKMNAEVFDAIRAFKDEHRSNGPEPVP
jgi:Protein of unknown function (DUF3105)